jgi:4-amino-4-deoxy-L-arabinose transferase-like glycosyltransferase
MTAILTKQQTSHRSNARPSQTKAWLRKHRVSLCILIPLLAIVGLAMAWNLQGYPGRVNDDEGTYTAEAWAIIHLHRLAPYTYWYDHPPVGWATIAVWAWLTNGFHRLPRAVMVSREVMWLATMATSGLLYGLARRLELRRSGAAIAVLLFGLSPLAIWYHRTVSLDNLSTMWAIAAFMIAASRRRSMGAAFWSAVCFAAATLSKETVAVVLPALIWQLWQHTDRRTRSWNLGIFGAAYLLIICFYPLFAILRGELVPGPGHVSLIGSAIYQLLSRQASGSLLDPHSGTFAMAYSWVSLDPWLALGGVTAILTGFLIRRLRPMALALLLQLLVMVKGGYVPFAFGVGMLPFAALLIAGTLDSLWNSPVHRSLYSLAIKRPKTPWLYYPGRVPAIAVALIFAVVAMPHWINFLAQQSKSDDFANEQAATQWVIRHAQKNQIVVVDDYPWLDIRLKSRATPLWLWKIDSDPQVMRELLPHGYKSITYMELEQRSSLTFSALPGRPTLQQAFDHSRIVARFGSMEIFKISR